MTDSGGVQDKLSSLLSEALSEITSADDANVLQLLKSKYAGRKGLIASLLKELPGLAPDNRGAVGEAINNAKEAIEAALESRSAALAADRAKASLAKERLDVTLPGRFIQPGRLHPITQVMNEVEDIFLGLGFDIAEGPQVELDRYNFASLNIPKNHPARDMQDTFYFSDDLLLRTHTSPVQIRVMESVKPPIRAIAPGAVFRRDSDITHTPMFHQLEGFMVDTNISFANLKSVLMDFLRQLFGEVGIRIRPSFFPFVEPGAEVDITCVICSGNGCRVCKETGWLEILGCGMIHPNVFKAVNYDPEEYTGFAFGLGIERIAMLKYGIDDIRLFYENDLRFLRQF
ncbi:MAG: phenylalanine--tRNA ligase subunit alpha [Deltaproteobacteria bacterium]|nr:phenylalanine--tRNA ligase subunit alpha [Deltaproteobacteria bacterium]